MNTKDVLLEFAQSRNLNIRPYKGVNIHYGNELQKWHLRFRYRNYGIEIAAGKEMLDINIPFHEDGLITSLNFSINRPLLLTLEPVTVKLPVGYKGLTLFKEKKSSGRLLKSWIKKVDSMHLLNAFHLVHNESLFIMPGAAELNLNPTHLLSEALDGLINLISNLPREETKLKPGMLEVHGLLINPDDLPKNIRVLVPLLAKWAIGDDVIRSNVYAAASVEEKRELVAIVYPLMDSINRYLDAHAGSNEAILLTHLAEGVSEINT